MDLKGILNTRRDLRRQQGVPPQLEKVVVYAHLRIRQYFPPETGNPVLQFRLRGNRFHRRLIGTLAQPSQLLSIDLAGIRLRQLRHLPEIAPNPRSKAILREQLSQLPAKYRIVLILRHLQDMTYEEMAEILTMPIGTIKTHLFRARNLLKERLEAFEREWRTRGE